MGPLFVPARAEAVRAGSIIVSICSASLLLAKLGEKGHGADSLVCSAILRHSTLATMWCHHRESAAVCSPAKDLEARHKHHDKEQHRRIIRQSGSIGMIAVALIVVIHYTYYRT